MAMAVTVAVLGGCLVVTLVFLAGTGTRCAVCADSPE